MTRSQTIKAQQPKIFIQGARLNIHLDESVSQFTLIYLFKSLLAVN